MHVNAPVAQRREQVAQILRRAVDVEGVGRFILGRWWRTASAEQQQEYLQLFEQVLIRNLSARFGEYQGVRFSLGRTQARTEEDVLVSTVVERPGNPAFGLDWRVAEVGGTPKVVDVIAEGTSLRLTDAQRLFQRDHPQQRQRRGAAERDAPADPDAGGARGGIGGASLPHALEQQHPVPLVPELGAFAACRCRSARRGMPRCSPAPRRRCAAGRRDGRSPARRGRLPRIALAAAFGPEREAQRHAAAVRAFHQPADAEELAAWRARRPTRCRSRAPARTRCRPRAPPACARGCGCRAA